MIPSRGWGIVLQDAACILNQQPLRGSAFPIYEIHATRNQGEEARVAFLTISPNDPLGTIVLPVPKTLRFSGLEAWFLREMGLLSSRDRSMSSIIPKDTTSALLFQIYHTNRPAGRKQLVILARIINPAYHEEIRVADT